MYGTHPHIREGIQGIPREELVIMSKTLARNRSQAQEDLARALREISTPYLDIFLIHSVDSEREYVASMKGVLQVLQEAKAQGKIRAFGMSTHNIHILEEAGRNPDLEILFANYNKEEVHMDGSLEYYTRVLQSAYDAGKGIMVMKTLGEGRIAHRIADLLPYNLGRPFIHAVCVGIVTLQELEQAARIAENPNAAPLPLQEFSL